MPLEVHERTALHPHVQQVVLQLRFKERLCTILSSTFTALIILVVLLEGVLWMTGHSLLPVALFLVVLFLVLKLLCYLVRKRIQRKLASVYLS